MDALSEALAKRRGKGLDSHLYQGATHEIDRDDKTSDVRDGYKNAMYEEPAKFGENGPHEGIDKRIGVDGKKSAKGEEHGEATPGDNLPHPEGQHTQAMNEGKGASPPANWRNKEHQDEHTSPVHENSGTPEPKSQSTGMGEGELKSQIREHVIGHESENEHEQLMSQGHKPRSLGERAKMMALKEKSEEKY